MQINIDWGFSSVKMYYIYLQLVLIGAGEIDPKLLLTKNISTSFRRTAFK